MKKVLLSLAVGGTIFGLTVYAANAKKQAEPTAALQPVHKSMSTAPAPRLGASTPAVSNPMPLGKGSADLAQSVAGIHQKALLSLQDVDQNELAQAVQEAFNAALVSRDFEKGVKELGNALAALASSVGSQLEICKVTKGKLTKAITDMSNDFEQLIRSGNLNTTTGEVYLVRVINEVLGGLKKGIGAAKVSNKNCSTQSAPAALPKTPSMPAAAQATSAHESAPAAKPTAVHMTPPPAMKSAPKSVK